jgi:hypothetical protein
VAAVSDGYPKFPKIPRLFRHLVVTEKIDGTNALVHVSREYLGTALMYDLEGSLKGAEEKGVNVIIDFSELDDAGEPKYEYHVRAGSRTRWISPSDDNFGFAVWVRNNATKLAELGEGNHYGEWWGKGIQRGYGQEGRFFSLFNVGRWHDPNAPWAALEGSQPIPEVPGLTTVPPLMGGVGDWVVGAALQALAQQGSIAAPGFPNPEGVVVFHTASNAYYKATLDNDGKPKTAVEPAKPKLEVVQSVPESLKQAQKRLVA